MCPTNDRSGKGNMLSKVSKLSFLRKANLKCNLVVLFFSKLKTKIAVTMKTECYQILILLTDAGNQNLYKSHKSHFNLRPENFPEKACGKFSQMSR